MLVIFECMNSLVTRIMGIFTDTVVPVVLLRQSSSRRSAPRKKRHAFWVKLSVPFETVVSLLKFVTHINKLRHYIVIS